MIAFDSWTHQTGSMCGRFTLRTPTETIADIFSQLSVPEIPPSYNIAPTQNVAAIRSCKSTDNAQASQEFAWLRWGLLPSWAKDKKMGARMINARSETVHEKPAFRSAFKKRRCLILADGFYEWLSTPDGKQPMYVTMHDDRPFCMAGLWETNKQIDDEKIESCTIITTSANPLMTPIHDRMPVILQEDRYNMWLDPAFEDREALQDLLAPFDDTQMAVRPVSRNVNKVSHNAADCIDPVATQGNLF